MFLIRVASVNGSRFKAFVENEAAFYAEVLFLLQNNITPLHVSSKWGRTNMVILLLDSHAEIDSKTRVSGLHFMLH